LPVASCQLLIAALSNSAIFFAIHPHLTFDSSAVHVRQV
jgi:hypothetical protein